MRNNLAMAYADEGKLDLSIEEYKKIIEGYDVYPNPHHNLANAYKIKKMYKEAEEEYKKALAIDGNFIFSYFGLAEIYKETGQVDNLETVTLKIIEYQKKL